MDKQSYNQLLLEWGHQAIGEWESYFVPHFIMDTIIYRFVNKAATVYIYLNFYDHALLQTLLCSPRSNDTSNMDGIMLSRLHPLIEIIWLNLVPSYWKYTYCYAFAQEFPTGRDWLSFAQTMHSYGIYNYVVDKIGIKQFDFQKLKYLGHLPLYIFLFSQSCTTKIYQIVHFFNAWLENVSLEHKKMFVFL